MRLGYIDYLNCYPFYYDMFEKEPLPGVEVVPRYPSGLNEGMLKGELDLSPVSAAAWAEMQDTALVLPDFCLSSIGYVRSVVINSNLPIEDLDGKKIGLTSASKTSVILLKILLKEYYRVNPVYVPVPPEGGLEGLDARVIIGNEAMLQCPEPVPYAYDLGDLWLRKTGHPVVFAVFTVQERFAKEHPELLALVQKSYHRSLLDLETEPSRVIDGARLRYPAITYDVAHYYQLLKFRFTSELKTALKFYYDIAARCGFLPTVPEIRFLEDGFHE